MAAKVKKSYDLTTGSIIQKLLLISIPILGTNIIEMIYNMADMFWLGNYLGSNAVAATGTVGMYLWLSMAFMAFGRNGGEIGVSQKMGSGDVTSAETYARSAIFTATILGTAFALVMILGRSPLIGFFGLTSPGVIHDAHVYMVITSIGIPFTFIGSAISGIFIGSGNSKIPFVANSIGLAVNMALDPVMIILMKMGVVGAALSTIIGQILTAAILIAAICMEKHRPFKVHLFTLPKMQTIIQLFRWAFPIALSNFVFTFLSMVMTRIVSTWGEGPLASMRIGGQIDSLSWLISGSFASSLTSFVGQNYGAGKWERIHKGFKFSLIAMTFWGLVCTFIQFFGGEFIYKLFLPNEPDVVSIGVTYLKFLAFCQVFSCYEGVVAGMFRGLGDTVPPSFVSIGVNSVRVIFAYFASQTPLGLNGVWLAITAGAILRGIILLLWYLKKYRKSGLRPLPTMQ